MNWTNHPTLYQLSHWWHWLAYGQNAAAIQAVAAVIAASAATAAGIFAARAYRATLAQLHMAKKQLDLAHSSFEVERARFEEDRQRTKRAAQTLFERMSAEEESTRPRFRNTSGYSPTGGSQTWEFMNYGTGAATDLSIFTSDGSEVLAQESIVGSGSMIRFRTTPQILDHEGVLFRFKTEFGSRWQIIIDLNGKEKILSVTRNYTPEGE